MLLRQSQSSNFTSHLNQMRPKLNYKGRIGNIGIFSFLKQHSKLKPLCPKFNSKRTNRKGW